jgi:hypothetical protein
MTIKPVGGGPPGETFPRPEGLPVEQRGRYPPAQIPQFAIGVHAAADPEIDPAAAVRT